ncbi:hypothetical protein [Actinophytocola xanthii]|uniref:hypothetical protein n=1 Tax=Actinophytocola xanthii TaxID=1912961 RepID=UPI001177EB49|nr:hypothetical protein [Actinophytocola xanthii]
MNRTDAQAIAKSVCEEVAGWPTQLIADLLNDKQRRSVSLNGVDYTVVIDALDESDDENIIHVIVSVDDGTAMGAIRPEVWGAWIRS